VTGEIMWWNVVIQSYGFRGVSSVFKSGTVSLLRTCSLVEVVGASV